MDYNELLEAVGQCVDRLDNLAGASVLPLPAEIHAQALSAGVASVRDELKAALKAAGFDPWADG